MLGISEGLTRDWLLYPVMKALKRIIMNQAEHAAELRALKAQNDKATAEQLAALQKVLDELAKAGDITPEVAEAMGELKASIQRDDDLNEDAAPPEPPVPVA